MRRTMLRNLVLAAGFVPALLAPTAAHAGTNGQQLEIVSGGCWGVVIRGQMWDNTFGNGYFDLPRVDNYIANYWWKGIVTLDCYDHAGNYRCRTTTNVPVSQPSDWWAVHIEPKILCVSTGIPILDDNVGVPSWESLLDPKPI